MVKIIMGRNLGVAAQATSVAIIITRSNRKGFTLAALAVIIISNCSSVPRPALVRLAKARLATAPRYAVAVGEEAMVSFIFSCFYLNGYLTVLTDAPSFAVPR